MSTPGDRRLARCAWPTFGLAGVLLAAGLIFTGCEQKDGIATAAAVVSLQSDRMSDQELEAERRSAEHLLELHRTVLQSQLANLESDDPALLAAIEETQRQICLAEQRRDDARRSLARRHNRIALAR